MVFIAGVISLAVLTDARVVTKQEQNTQAHNILSDRDVIWHAAAEQIGSTRCSGWVKKTFGRSVLSGQMASQAMHRMHNIYINVLTEGNMGLSVGLWAVWRSGYHAGPLLAA